MGRLSYSELLPAPDLACAIECIWVTRDREAVTGRPLERVLPDGCMEIVFHLGDPFHRLTGGHSERQPRSFLAGQLTRHLVLQPPARVHTVGVRFRPAGAFGFFPAHLTDLRDRFISLVDLWGRDAPRLEAELEEAGTDRERVTALERVLRRHCGRRGASDPRVIAAVRRLIGDRGATRIPALAAGVGWSPRQLERRFLAEVGLSPKSLARTVRLQSAVRRLHGAPAAIEVVLGCGFFDQSHLLRDFRELAGAPPSQLLETGGGLAMGLLSEERLRAYFGED